MGESWVILQIAPGVNAATQTMESDNRISGAIDLAIESCFRRARLDGRIARNSFSPAQARRTEQKTQGDNKENLYDTSVS